MQENTVVADRFRLVRMIGRGGMGSVWQAVHIGLETPCALKFIEGELANLAEAHARFEREAKAAAQLRSPHIVQVFDHGVWQGRPFIAMELLEGVDLSQMMADAGGKLPPATVNMVLQQVCRALTKAHSAGIVHRDLKPDNVFICKDEPEFVKVLDFGVAKIKSTELGGSTGSRTQTGTMIGTPYYMSPEQTQAKEADPRADLWSIAVIAYECLTGQLPFAGDSFGELIINICTKPVPVPSRVTPVPPGFDEWFVRGTQRDRERRFQSAREMAAELARIGQRLGPTGAHAVHNAPSNPPPAPPPRTIYADGGVADIAPPVRVVGGMSGSSGGMSGSGATPAKSFDLTTGQRAVTSQSFAQAGPSRVAWITAGVGAAVIALAGASFFALRSPGAGGAAAGPTELASSLPVAPAPPPGPAATEASDPTHGLGASMAQATLEAKPEVAVPATPPPAASSAAPAASSAAPVAQRPPAPEVAPIRNDPKPHVEPKKAPAKPAVSAAPPKVWKF